MIIRVCRVVCRTAMLRINDSKSEKATEHSSYIGPTFGQSGDLTLLYDDAPCAAIGPALASHDTYSGVSAEAAAMPASCPRSAFFASVVYFDAAEVEVFAVE